jgi:hypothetical protein
LGWGYNNLFKKKKHDDTYHWDGDEGNEEHDRRADKQVSLHAGPSPGPRS